MGPAGPHSGGADSAAADVFGGLRQQHVHQPGARIRPGPRFRRVGQPLDLLDRPVPGGRSCRPHLLQALHCRVRAHSTSSIYNKVHQKIAVSSRGHSFGECGLVDVIEALPFFKKKEVCLCAL